MTANPLHPTQARKVVALAFLSAVAGWEDYVECAFLRYLAGASSGNGRQATPRAGYSESLSHASDLVFGRPGYRPESDYLNWTPREYSVILSPRGVNCAEILSKKLLPDEALHVLESRTVYIIEKKFQSSAGSVDEKLQTCHFKKKQYSKLFDATELDVEYLYVLNDWFRHPSYQDVLTYIEECGCRYYFNEIPLSSLGLPGFSQP